MVNRGSDLQKELDENSRIEESLRREIAAELEKEPSHPIVTDAAKAEEPSAPVVNKEIREPSTPTGEGNDGTSSQMTPSPDVSSPDSGVVIDGLPVGNHGISIFGEPCAFPFSPNSIDNADLGNPGLPGYRRNGSLDEADFYGCGATSFLSGQVRLFGDSRQQPTSPMRLTVDNENRGRTISADGGGHPTLSPTLTSSFDTIDFRTGMSGHRGLNNPKKHNAPHSPTPRTRMMMSEHRGIGRVRGPLNRSATSNSPSSTS